MAISKLEELALQVQGIRSDMKFIQDGMLKMAKMMVDTIQAAANDIQKVEKAVHGAGILIADLEQRLLDLEAIAYTEVDLTDDDDGGVPPRGDLN